uniref:Uncharacterized protein n=1 Tax=Nothobranchius rachovii TaxID=451742 RepID=A0A1A8S187_9TELE
MWRLTGFNTPVLVPVNGPANAVGLIMNRSAEIQTKPLYPTSTTSCVCLLVNRLICHQTLEILQFVTLRLEWSAGVVDTLCKPEDNSYNTENSVLTPRCSTYIQILNIYNNTMKQSHYLVNTFSHSYSACSIRTNRMVRKVHKSTFCCKQKTTTSE